MLSMKELSKQLATAGVAHKFVSASEIPDDYEAKRKTFLAGVKQIIETYGKKNDFKPLMNVDVEVSEGKVYDRVTYKEMSGGDKVYCFINRSNGDILKAATFKAPAKGARGNLFDDHNGLTRMGPYGPAYNK